MFLNSSQQHPFGQGWGQFTKTSPGPCWSSKMTLQDCFVCRDSRETRPRVLLRCHHQQSTVQALPESHCRQRTGGGHCQGPSTCLPAVGGGAVLRGPNWPRLMDAPLGIDGFGHRSRTRGQPQRGVRGNWQLAIGIAFHELLASEVVAARSMSMGETAHRVGRLNSQLPTMVRSRSLCLLLPGAWPRPWTGSARP